jgi:hypothetical protein
MPTIAQQAKDGVVRDFRIEVDNGNSGAAKTVDWRNGQKQKVVMTAVCTFTFTAPPGVGNFIFKIVQDGTGGWTAVWPGSVKWIGAVPPTLSAAAGAVDIVSFYFDGTDYFGVIALNFA